MRSLLKEASSSPPDLDSLRALVDQGDGGDRAYVDALIRMGWWRTEDSGMRADLERLHADVQTAALRSHAAVRARIAEGRLRGAALRSHFDQVPPFERDHYVEEVLGIAYPPLEEPERLPELMAYAPSGYDEIVHSLDASRLGPGDRFLDVGSGLGKAVMLAAALTFAKSAGVEYNGTLHDLAERAARDLRLDEARSILGDAREVALEDADVFFMYLPFTGATLATVMARLVERGVRPHLRERFLCAGALDLRRYPQLSPAGPSRSWLHVYAWR